MPHFSVVQVENVIRQAVILKCSPGFSYNNLGWSCYKLQ